MISTQKRVVSPYFLLPGIVHQFYSIVQNMLGKRRDAELQENKTSVSETFIFSTLSHLFLCRKFECLSSLLGSSSMVERLKDICLDVDADCMEMREILARDITEVRSAKDWLEYDFILCRL